MYQNILTRLKVNCKDNGRKANGNDKGAKPKMVNKSSNNSEKKQAKPRSNNGNVGFVGHLSTLPLIVMLIHLWKPELV